MPVCLHMGYGLHNLCAGMLMKSSHASVRTLKFICMYARLLHMRMILTIQREASKRCVCVGNIAPHTREVCGQLCIICMCILHACINLLVCTIDIKVL